MMTQIRINENIYLHYIPMQKLKTTTVELYLHRPLNDDEASKNALLPYVLRRGCGLCRDSEAIEKYLEERYGADMSSAVIKRGDSQLINISMETISERYAADREPLLEDLIRLLMSVVFEPVTENGAFCKSFFDQEQKNAVDRIKSLINDKRVYAQLRCIQELCRGSRYAVSALGTEEGVKVLTAEGLYEHYQSIINSSVIDIYVCGECEMQKIAAIIKDAVSGLSFSPAERPQTERSAAGKDTEKVTERLDVVQGKLSLGYYTGTMRTDPDYYAMQVAAAIFGGGTQSKLFMNVREKLSLAYYASASLLPLKDIMVVNAGIEFAKFDDAYNEILSQLAALQNGEVSEEEFAAAVNILVYTLESTADSQRRLIAFELTNTITGMSETIEEVIAKIKSVTLEQAVKASKKIKLGTVYFLTGKESE